MKELDVLNFFGVESISDLGVFRSDLQFEINNDESLLRSYEAFKNDAELNISQIALFEQFLIRLKSDSLCVEMVSSALLFDEIRIYVDFLGDLAVCNRSFNYLNRNILRFSTAADKVVFFIIQHVSSCDAIYFPKYNMYKIFKHIDENMLKILISNLLEDADADELDMKFGGVICSHGRPYHYYYDTALALRKIFIAGLLDKIPKVIQMVGGDFASVSKVYNVKIKEPLCSSVSLNLKAKEENEFYIHVGILFDKKKHYDLVKGHDVKMVHSVKHMSFPSYVNELAELDKRKFVLWIGITGQKRSWLEQIDAAIKLINSLSLDPKDIGIIFDGWTSPLHRTEVDLLETNNDRVIIDWIIKAISDEIFSFTVAGLDSLTKLKFATMADFFIANQSTGSLHICRMSNVPGITHISQDLFDESLNVQILDTAIKYPKDAVLDIPDPENPRMDFTSYSIDPQLFVDFALPHIEKLIYKDI
jgi:hypothetical protein